MSDLWPEIAPWQRTDTEPLTVTDLLGEPPKSSSHAGWVARQRVEALIRERTRRVDAETALRRLRDAVEAHRGSVPPRNARKADRALWTILDAIGDDDG